MPKDPSDDFRMEGDYRLLAGSPCIDAADNKNRGRSRGTRRLIPVRVVDAALCGMRLSGDKAGAARSCRGDDPADV